MSKIQTIDSPPLHPFGEQFLTRQGVAARLRIDVKTLDAYRRQPSKKFPKPAFRWGRSPMWCGADVDAWLEWVSSAGIKQ